MSEATKIRAIITGATGMVGEGVLHECLLREDVEAVLVLSRKTCGVTHPKLKEVLHSDFYDLTAIENELTGYNTCFFCMGVSSVGMNKALYYKITYTLTLNVAKTLSILNREMVFCYISGAGTDSTGKSSSTWAKVKGKTENDLMKLPFKKAYAFRPGIILPTEGLTNTLKLYKYLGWLLPVFRLLTPKQISTLKQLGQAMINAAARGYDKQVLEVTDIITLSKIN